jgi:hypothetical protein
MVRGLRRRRQDAQAGLELRPLAAGGSEGGEGSGGSRGRH